MDGNVMVAMLGTACAIVAAVLAGNRWLIGAAIRQDTAPLVVSMTKLEQTAKALTDELREAKAQQVKGTDELHEAIEAVRQVLEKHQEHISDSRERIAVLEVIANQTHTPKSKRAPRARTSTT